MANQSISGDAASIRVIIYTSHGKISPGARTVSLAARANPPDKAEWPLRASSGRFPVCERPNKRVLCQVDGSCAGRRACPVAAPRGQPAMIAGVRASSANQESVVFLRFAHKLVPTLSSSGQPRVCVPFGQAKSAQSRNQRMTMIS